jgi:hypothetical protein
VTGARFANLFALRQAKLAALLSLLNRDCAVILVRMEVAQSAPQDTLDAILAGLGQPARGGAFRPVVKRLGSKFKAAVDDRPTMPETWPEADRAFLRAASHADQEAALGYDYD